MKRFLCILAISLASATICVGCQKKEEPKETTKKEFPVKEQEVAKETSKKTEPKVEKEENHEGQARSYLTGEWVDEAVARQRPFACMMGNTSDAMPQYGIGNADVIYEVPVEGSFTRLMPIFQDYANMGTIESIRSCRLYFAYFAKEFDAIYAHWGEAHYATEFLKSMDDLDGEDGALGNTFFRDHNRKAPHNGCTSGENIVNAISQKGYTAEHAADYAGHYRFNEKDKKDVVLKDGRDAAVVSVGYAVNKPWFVYDKKAKKYLRYQFSDAQIDGATQKQLSVKNILLQYTPWYNEDENGYLNFQTVSSGSGVYITDGKAIDVTWSKSGENEATHYYDASGEEITLNQGKTWVCVVQDSRADKVAVYATEDEFHAAQ